MVTIFLHGNNRHNQALVLNFSSNTNKNKSSKVMNTNNTAVDVDDPLIGKYCDVHLIDEEIDTKMT